jgi:hypothetical protein
MACILKRKNIVKYADEKSSLFRNDVRVMPQLLPEIGSKLASDAAYAVKRNSGFIIRP